MERMEPSRRLDQQIRFILEIDRLKGVLRRNTTVDAERRENSAEHSWHITVMVEAFAEHAPPGTDLARVTTMLLVHDIVEIDAGDTFVYDSAAAATQRGRELAAARRIFALLPDDQAQRFRAAWEEFEERATAEAKFAKALDRLQPMLVNYHTGGGTWVRYGVTADQVRVLVGLIEDGSPALGSYATELITDAVRRGYLAPAP